DEAIDAAAAAFRAVDIELGVIDDGGHVNAGRQGELFHRGTAHLEVEPAGDLQDRVTDRFGVQPAAVHAPQVTVVGVRQLWIGSGRPRNGRGLPVGGAGDDELVQ